MDEYIKIKLEKIRARIRYCKGMFWGFFIAWFFCFIYNTYRFQSGYYVIDVVDFITPIVLVTWIVYAIKWSNASRRYKDIQFDILIENKQNEKK